MVIEAVSEVITMPPPPEFIEANTISRLCAENIELVRKLAAANLLIEQMQPVIDAVEKWQAVYTVQTNHLEEESVSSRVNLSYAIDVYRHWLANQEQIRIFQEAVKKYERHDQANQ